MADIDENKGKVNVSVSAVTKNAGKKSEMRATDPHDMNIYQKLAAITGRVAPLAKGGTNAEQHYNFIEYAAVAGELRGLFAEFGVLIIPRMPKTAEQNRTEFKTARGGTGVAVLIDFTFEVINADKPDDRFEVGWTGEATDYGDKGTNKAATAALKYYLMRQFNISEKGEQEADASSPERAAAPEPKPAPATQKATIRYITQEQVDELSAILEDKGMRDTDDQEALVKKMGKVTNVSNITELSAEALIERIKASDDIAKMFEFIGKEYVPSTDVVITDISDEPINLDEVPDFGAPSNEPVAEPVADVPDDSGVLKEDEPTPPAPKSYDQPEAAADPTDVLGTGAQKPVDDKFKEDVKRSLDALGLRPQQRMRLLKDSTGSVTPNNLSDEQWRNFADAIDDYAINMGDKIAGNETQNDGGELDGVTDQTAQGNAGDDTEVGA